MKHEPITGERMTHWYAAVVKRQREQAACEALEGAGFVAYVPTETKVKRQPRRRLTRQPLKYAPAVVETIEAPVVHGILFLGTPVRLAWDFSAWWHLMQVCHPNSDEPVLRSIYGNGGVPGEIPEWEIDAMLARRDKRVADLMRPDAAKFAPDSDVRIKVRLKAGDVEELRATVKELIPGTHRYKLIGELFGREVPMEADEADIESWAAE